MDAHQQKVRWSAPELHELGVDEETRDGYREFADGVVDYEPS